jgi:hypothetical protein
MNMRILKAIVGTIFLMLVISCQDILEVTDISDETVQLLAPSDSSIVAQTNVTFSWNEVFEATAYHMQLATPNFEHATQIILDSVVVLDSTYLGTRMTKTLTDSEYEWRVKALNSDFETDFSASFFSVNTSGN